MSNPILNAEQFRDGVCSFASQVEFMQRVGMQFSADIDGLREFGREFERNVTRLAKIEAMKVANEMRARGGNAPAYGEADFEAV